MITKQNIAVSPFEAVKEFAKFSGWRKQKVFIGDDPDFRRCELLSLTFIDYSFPSQTSLLLGNGSRFRTDTETIWGRKRFIFLYSQELHFRLRRHEAERSLKYFSKTGSPEDVRSLAELALRRTLGRLEDARSQLNTHLPTMSLDDLETLAMLAVGALKQQGLAA